MKGLRKFTSQKQSTKQNKLNKESVYVYITLLLINNVNLFFLY